MASIPWSTILPVIASLAGGMLAGRGSGSGGSSWEDQYNKIMQNQILQNAVNRMWLDNPLYEEANTLARRLLPKSARPTNYRLFQGNPATPPSDGGGGPNPNPSPGPGPGEAFGSRLAALRALGSGVPGPLTKADLFRR